ncbi:hypothetical protein [Mesorhizobium sp. M0809]|uniref:hypothetical protein n=1 Tax=Mesorhizobium sp. M0809 TaxID=2957003 RepID=UPI003335BAC7
MTGFVVKNSCVASQEFNRKAVEVGQRRCSDGAAPAIAMALRYHLSDRNRKNMSSRPWPRFYGDAKRVMRVQDLTVAENMSRPIQPAILGTPKVFKV